MGFPDSVRNLQPFTYLRLKDPDSSSFADDGYGLSAPVIATGSISYLQPNSKSGDFYMAFNAMRLYLSFNATFDIGTSGGATLIVTFRTTDSITTGYPLVSIYHNTTNDCIQITFTDSTTLRCSVRDTGTWWDEFTIPAINDGDWKQIIATVNPIGARVFVNGTKYSGTNAHTNGRGFSFTRLVMGGRLDVSSLAGTFTGDFDDCACFSRSLTDAECNNLHAVWSAPLSAGDVSDVYTNSRTFTSSFSSGSSYKWEITPISSSLPPSISSPTASSTQITFFQTGTYRLSHYATNSSGFTDTANTNVTVVNGFSQVSINGSTSPTANLLTNTQHTFPLKCINQFGKAFTPSLVVWSVQSGVGSINSNTGLYTTGDSSGDAVIRASITDVAGSTSIDINVTVTNVPASDPSPLSPSDIVLQEATQLQTPTISVQQPYANAYSSQQNILGTSPEESGENVEVF
jgi:hypothetical protein